MKKLLLSLLALLILVGCENVAYIETIPSLTYVQILEQGIEPSISPDYKFPSGNQYMNGCFAFSVNNVLQYKYDKKIDLLEAEKKVEKPRLVLWTGKYIMKFLNEYDLKMVWYKDSENFFKLLEQGEPVVMQYTIPLETGELIGHIVVAYSFDDKGIWIADSLKGKTHRLDFSDVFTEKGDETRYGFATVHTLE